uniref:NYN domain-containing protein n=1 Tax=Parascaris equorum TaxID=6256 RepID=A0A914S4N5_PAREQ
MGWIIMVIDVVNPRGGESVLAACDRVRKAAEAKSLCNFGFSVMISTWNDIVKKEMGLVVKDKGINSFIIDLHSDDQLYQAFLTLEGEFIDRVAVLSQLTNCPLAVMSVSSSEARNAVLRNRINSVIFPEVSR